MFFPRIHTSFNTQTIGYSHGHITTYASEDNVEPIKEGKEM